MTLGEKIWRLRESRNMSQEELAEMLGVSRQTISNWENGKAVLDAEKLAALCSVFDVSADDMLNADGLPTVRKKAVSSQQKSNNKRLSIIILSIIAFVFIVIAAVGMIVTDDKVSMSSLITFHRDFIWIALFIIGGASLVSAVVILFKRK